MTYNFYDQKKKAKPIERAVKKFLESNPETVSVEDVRKEKLYRLLEIDFLWYKKDPFPWGVEVKADFTISGSGNFFLEVWEDVPSKYPGGFKRSLAHYWIIVDAVKKILYLFDVNNVRSYCRDKERRTGKKFLTKDVNWKIDRKRGVSRGLLVPVRELLGVGLVRSFENYEESGFVTTETQGKLF